ncbi:hypothetical protein TWF481_003243 [Arthrobotrys musiformis]|uniref:F-box domain-containing protein n=1 Tax=Arthrobotrys musiformis TaxID=47236 RepID=A0AAV9VSP3_9PEZI
MARNLPTEILLQIFEAIDGPPRSDIPKVVLVCKRWRSLAEPLLYRRVEIDYGDADGGPNTEIRCTYKPKLPGGCSKIKPFKALFLKNAGSVRHIHILLDNIHAEVVDISNISELFEPIKYFQNATSLTCEGNGSNARCGGIWAFLDFVLNSLPQLRCLTISRFINMRFRPIKPSVESGEVKASRRVSGEGLGRLKEIRVFLEVGLSYQTHIDELFGKMVETFGPKATELVSELDVYLGSTTMRNKDVDTTTPQLPTWILDNLRRLKFTDAESIHAVPDLLRGDFKQLRWLNVEISSWDLWKAQLIKRRQISPKSDPPFPNLEIFGLTRVWAGRPDDDDDDESGESLDPLNTPQSEWPPSIIIENLKFFPKLTEFRISEAGIHVYEIERAFGGKVVYVGKDYLLECTRESEEGKWWLPPYYYYFP